MKTVTLKFPLGPTHRVSRDAAEFALIIDKIADYPQLSKSLFPALEAIKLGFAGVQAFEKIHGQQRTKEFINESLRLPSK